MKIGCIGWGSLIWDDSRDFEISGEWQLDGPVIPIEFARQSSTGNITLVIEEKAKPVQTLWVNLVDKELPKAIERLRLREGTVARHIHFIDKNSIIDNPIKEIISDWMKTKEFDAIIWTGLPPKFEDENNRVPTIEELRVYFHELKTNQPEIYKSAKKYILKAPEQVKTKYRPQLEEMLID